jgi:hypothetical protein
MSTTVSGIRKAADGRRMEAHGTTDFGQTVLVIEMGPANGFIAP